MDSLTHTHTLSFSRALSLFLSLGRVEAKAVAQPCTLSGRASVSTPQVCDCSRYVMDSGLVFRPRKTDKCTTLSIVSPVEKKICRWYSDPLETGRCRAVSSLFVPCQQIVVYNDPLKVDRCTDVSTLLLPRQSCGNEQLLLCALTIPSLSHTFSALS